MANSRDQSPIEVNFKRARYVRHNHFDDFDMGDDVGFEDFLIADWDTFIEQGTLDQQDAPTKKNGNAPTWSTSCCSRAP